MTSMSARADHKTIVITGSSDGIGAAAARALSAKGHSVVIVGRSPDKTKAVANELGAPFYLVDYAQLDSVRGLAARLRADLPRIDVLANNAGGIFGTERKVTGDGHEITFQVNYLAPFLLTGLLLDRLIGDQALVINTASVANRLFGKLDITDLDAARGTFDARRAYGTAKLEQIMFTSELARRYGAQGLSSAAFHPGVIGSSFGSSSGSALGWIYQNRLAKRFLGTTETGADTLNWLAENCPSTTAPSGRYFAHRKVTRPARQATDESLRAALWDASVQLTHLSLPKSGTQNPMKDTQ